MRFWDRLGNLTDLAGFAAEYGLAVVEDAAHGTVRDGKQAGTVGIAGCFSLKDGKIR